MWDVIDKYFKENPDFLVAHQLDSYNDFIHDKIKYIIHTLQEEFTIIEINKQNNKDEFKIITYVGGKDNNKIYISKPIIKDENGTRPLFPNEARLKDITYSVDIFVDILVEIIHYKSNLPSLKKGQMKDETDTILKEKIKLCSIPIMVKSKMCSLYKQPGPILTEVGECPYDTGGYFIIDGKEKVIVSQETLVTNRIFINKVEGGSDIDKYKYRAQVRNTEEDNNLFPKIIKLYMYNDIYAEGKKHNAITVEIPVKSKIDMKNSGENADSADTTKEVPLCILFRAFGIESDKEIAKYILTNFDDPVNIKILNFLQPTFNDGSHIYTQLEALTYLYNFVQFNQFDTESDKEKYNLVNIQNIIMHDIFPNIGTNFKDKAFILGYYTNVFIKTALGILPDTYRDNYMHKRISVPGTLMISIFRDFYNQFRNNYRKNIDIPYSNGLIKSIDNLKDMFSDARLYLIFDSHFITDKIYKSFKGDWGLLDESAGDAKRQRQGYVQDLNRLSHLGTISHLRRVRTPMNTDIKIVEPHKLHPSQYGVLCSTESPDGINIGIIKHFAMTTYITGTFNLEAIKECLDDHGVINIKKINITQVSNSTKIMINDTWYGIHHNPYILYNKLKLLKRNAIISIFTGINWNVYKNEIHIRMDSGRCVRPLLIVKDNKLLIKADSKYMEKSWLQLIKGITIADKDFNLIEHSKEYKKGLLTLLKYDYNTYNESNADTKLLQNASVIEYVDIEEVNYILLAMHESELEINKTYAYTHCEIHPSLAFSTYTNSVPFFNHNQSTRVVMSGAQGKQALGIYATNFNNRIDTASYVLHYPQKPLVNTKYDVYCNTDVLPNGENLIVAIMTYSGYNQEDAVIFNQAAIDRGCFNVTGYNAIVDEEKIDEKRKVKKLFTNTKEMKNFHNINIKEADYSTIDKNGLPIENAYIDDKHVLLGKYVEEEYSYSENNEKNIFSNESNVFSTQYRDESKLGSRLTYGHVDKVYLYSTKNQEKKVKIRMRNFKQPKIGDKAGCVKGDVLVLTNYGWKEIKDITLEDKVAILDKGSLVYENPIKLHKYDYNGKLYDIKSDYIDLTVTPDHRMYIRTPNNEEFRFCNARDCMNNGFYYKTHIENYEPEEWIGETYTLQFEHDKQIIAIDDWIRLIGLFIAYGSYCKNKENNTNYIQIIYNGEISKKYLIMTTFTNLQLDYEFDENKTYIIKNTNIIKYLQQYKVNKYSTYIPDFYKQLNKKQLRLLLSFIMSKDSITTKSKVLYEQLSIIAIHAGYVMNLDINKINDDTYKNNIYYEHEDINATDYINNSEQTILNDEIIKYINNISNYEESEKNRLSEFLKTRKNTSYSLIEYTITIQKPYSNKQLHTMTQQQMEQWIDYKGYVYCLSVRTEIFMIKQNNKICWTGNSKHGQKGTIGMILPTEEMPFNSDGIVPDIIINPHAFPKRMTIGHLLECLLSKLVCCLGKSIDGTAFDNNNLHDLFKYLNNYGFDDNGDELLYNGKTGEQISTKIFIGPTFYYRLKHMTADKINYRIGSKLTLPDGGKISNLVRQPPHGRANDGGLRMGEMEVNAVLAHGVGSLIKETMFDKSDKYSIMVDNDTGRIPIYNLEKSKLYQYNNNISQIHIPYAFKLLSQEAMGLNINPRFITNDMNEYNILQKEDEHNKEFDKLFGEYYDSKKIL